MKQGWEIKKLSEIGKVFNGNSINEKVKKDKYTNLDDGLPFIATKDVGFDSEIDYKNGVRIPFNEINQFKIAPSNTPLICAEGGSAGRKIAFTNQNVCFGNKLFAFVPNKNVESKYVFYYYFTSSFQKHFSTEMAGIIGGVSMNKFKDIEIPLPPLPEQQRIISILDEAFAAIAKAKANAEQNLKNAKELFESYLQGVFENGNWEEQELGDLCMLITKGSSPKWQGIKYVDEPGILFVTSENVGEGKMLLNERKYVEEKFNLKDKKSILKKGDVLTNIVGASIGRTAIYDIDDVANINQAVCILRCNPKYILNNYLMNLLNSPFLKKILHDNEVNTARANLSLGFFNKLSIPCPTMAEQQAIVRQLDALRAETQKLEAVYQKKMDDLEELKKSILQKAFAGELGDGEPAEPKTEKSRRDDKIIENKINHPRTNPEGVL